MDENILVLGIDDDPNLLRVSERVLEKAGYTVLSALTGTEGLRLAQKHKPDLILLDVNLPDISGIDVCKQLKADETLSDIRIIMLSSVFTESEEQALGLEDGADGYIARPVSNRELLARVDAMIRLIKTEKELAQKTLELERSNADLESFAYMASHDLKEPLRMVRQFLGLLERKYQSKLEPEAQEYVQYAVDGANRMEAMINALLEYSRINTAGAQFSTVALDETLAQILHDLQFSIEDAAATITYDALPTVIGDESQLRSLFQNLIANALKFRDDKPLKIHVGVKKEEEHWVFSVKDNGIGIQEKQFDRLFSIFQRLNSREEYSGTGIGLAVCKRIVERHDGRIWIESKFGEGSTFHFTLPIKGV